MEKEERGREGEGKPENLYANVALDSLERARAGEEVRGNPTLLSRENFAAVLAWPSASYLERIAQAAKRKRRGGCTSISGFYRYTTIITDVFVISVSFACDPNCDVVVVVRDTRYVPQRYISTK